MCGFVNSRRVTSYPGTFRLAFYLHFTVSTLQTAGNSEKLRTMLSLRMLLQANENDDDNDKKENDDGQPHFCDVRLFLDPRRHAKDIRI